MIVMLMSLGVSEHGICSYRLIGTVCSCQVQMPQRLHGLEVMSMSLDLFRACSVHYKFVANLWAASRGLHRTPEKTLGTTQIWCLKSVIALAAPRIEHFDWLAKYTAVMSLLRNPILSMSHLSSWRGGMQVSQPADTVPKRLTTPHW